MSGARLGKCWLTRGVRRYFILLLFMLHVYTIIQGSEVNVCTRDIDG